VSLCVFSVNLFLSVAFTGGVQREQHESLVLREQHDLQRFA
jgi:hypothetical protein